MTFGEGASRVERFWFEKMFIFRIFSQVQFSAI